MGHSSGPEVAEVACSVRLAKSKQSLGFVVGRSLWARRSIGWGGDGKVEKVEKWKLKLRLRLGTELVEVELEMGMGIGIACFFWLGLRSVGQELRANRDEPKGAFRAACRGHCRLH